MPFIVWINEIFPEPQAPYSLKEITFRLQQMYDPGISYPKVNHAYHALLNNAALFHVVSPLNPGEKYLCFSAEAARRIARKVTNCKPPKHLGFGTKELLAARNDTTAPPPHLMPQNTAKCRKIPQKSDISEKLVPKSKQRRTDDESPLAA